MTQRCKKADIGALTYFVLSNLNFECFGDLNLNFPLKHFNKLGRIESFDLDSKASKMSLVARKASD